MNIEGIKHIAIMCIYVICIFKIKCRKSCLNSYNYYILQNVASFSYSQFVILQPDDLSAHRKGGALSLFPPLQAERDCVMVQRAQNPREITGSECPRVDDLSGNSIAPGCRIMVLHRLLRISYLEQRCFPAQIRMQVLDVRSG